MSIPRICLAAVALGATACASTGGWQGAAAERTYDQNLEAIRATAVLNNDDYYEIHQDGRIYVLADAGDLKLFLENGEIPLRVTRIGGGPKGETVVFGIARPESRKKDGFGAVEMFDGRRKGSDKNFYAEIFADNQYYVFGDWASLESFRKGQPGNLSRVGSGPKGEPVLATEPALLGKFRTLHAAR